MKECRNKYNCSEKFTFAMDHENEIMIFAECVECGYLNFIGANKIDSC